MGLDVRRHQLGPLGDHRYKERATTWLGRRHWKGPAQRQRLAYRADAQPQTLSADAGDRAPKPAVNRTAHAAYRRNVAISFTAETNVAAPYRLSTPATKPPQSGRSVASLPREQKGAVRWETTVYAGTHWGQAFVLKDNVCVARSGRKLVKVWHRCRIGLGPSASNCATGKNGIRARIFGTPLEGLIVNNRYFQILQRWNFLQLSTIHTLAVCRASSNHRVL